MNKAAYALVLILTIVVTFDFVSNARSLRQSSIMLYVDDDNTEGPWDGSTAHPFQNITSGLEHAPTGDTIFVLNGTYHERIQVDKSVSLVGENKYGTTINGRSSGDVVLITADSVEIANFTISNASWYGGNGFTVASAVRIENASDCKISNNIITNSHDGIELEVSSNNIIADNYVVCPPHGVGIAVYGDGNIIKNNTVSSGYMGILIIGFYNTLERNTVYSNHYGIRLAGSSNNTIVANDVSKNNKGLYIASYAYPGVNNFICHNNFVNNTIYQAREHNSTNIWHNGYPSGGNYWSNYNGTDSLGGPYQNETGSDRIGDTPYIIPYMNSSDQYPLMNPWMTDTIIGDINHDGKVNILDVVAIASIYGSKEGDYNWNPHADIAPPYGVIDILDLVTCIVHYGETYP